MAINGIRFGQQGQLSKAISYLKLATKLNPRHVGAWANLVNVNKMMAKSSNSHEAEKYLKSAEKYSKKLDDLGFVHPKDVPQFTSAGRPK
jgi:tetratricopeptide (TPR) repeat protein